MNKLPSILPRAHKSKILLLPVSTRFIWLSLLIVWLIGMFPWPRSWIGVPDFLAVSLAFWITREPTRVGFTAAFVFGLLVDVHQGALFGHHALFYVILAYFVTLLRHRILWFSVPVQILYLFPLFFGAQFIALVLRAWVLGFWPGWLFLFISTLNTVVFWPVAHWLLLAPQRRAIGLDKNRPI